MAIHAPRSRLFQSISLGFVTRGIARSRRSTAASLSLTSMIDFLVVMVVFLLTTFSPAARGHVNVEAVNVTDLLDAPTVAVEGNQVFLDGRSVDTTTSLEGRGRVEVLSWLEAALKAQRATWKQLNPGKPAPGAVVLQLDKDTRALTTKSVFLTAARAGYPNVSFLVQKARR